MKKQVTFLILASVLVLGACSHQGNHDRNGKGCSGCGFHQKDEACRGMSKTPAYFDFDSSILSEGDKTHLDKIAKRLERNPSEKVRLAGYTDSTGSEEYNMTLSKERAESAARYLESLGVDQSRILIRAYGASDYADSNATSSGRAKNRRVEATFFK